MSKSIDIAIKAAEQQYEREMSNKLSQRMAASVEDNGAVDSFRNTILSHVAQEAYSRAIDEIRTYVEGKDEFPQFKARADRYVSYSIDLINAVKAKRSFPGLQHLSMSKQQELFDRAMDHFDELKGALRKVEQIDREVRLEDVRSTVWVVKALIYSVFAILLLAFLLEISKGLAGSAYIVADDLFGRFTNWIFDLLGV